MGLTNKIQSIFWGSAAFREKMSYGSSPLQHGVLRKNSGRMTVQHQFPAVF
jgi:hypothetical protein